MKIKKVHKKTSISYLFMGVVFLIYILIPRGSHSTNSGVTDLKESNVLSKDFPEELRLIGQVTATKTEVVFALNTCHRYL